MSRSYLCVLLVVAALSTGCGMQHHGRCAEPIQVTRPHSRPYGKAGTMYVRIRGGSPDAVILRTPSQWSKVVAPLEYGQAVVVEDKSGRYAYVHTRDLGINFEGWVLAAALAKRVPDNPHEPDYALSGPNYPFSATEAADYLYPYEEFDGELGMQNALASMDEYEARLDELRGRDPINPDSKIIRERFIAWGKAGGLLPEEDD